MSEMDWSKLRGYLLELGMEGDDPRGYLLGQGLEDSVEMAETMFADDGDARAGFLAYFASLYLRGLRVGQGIGVDDGSRQAVAVSCGRNPLNPALLHLYVGVTMGAVGQISRGVVIRQDLNAGSGEQVLLTVFGGKSTEALQERFVELMSDLVSEMGAAPAETVH